MRIAILFDPWMLSFRKSLDLDGYRDDPRGLSGSEMAAVRLCEELWSISDRRDSAYLFTVTKECGMARPWGDQLGGPEWDIAISINCPDPLRDVQAKFKVCYALLNDWTFAKAGFEEHVDLFASPSQPHLDQVLHNPAWRAVETSPQHPNGKVQYEPDPKRWCVVPLGADPDHYAGYAKVPGRVIHCSSPDRGLHWLLQEWPRIKRAAPHASLRIFYRVREWIESMKAQCGPGGQVYHSVWPNVQRALYIDEALRRMTDIGGYDIELCDSVSRAQIEREMAQAEVFAFPCSPLNAFTEGFSCATLESCAARACPVITDADAFRGVYGEALPLVPRAGDWVPQWRDQVIRALTDATWRDEVNDRAEAFARRHTWRDTAEKLMAEIERRRA